MFSRLSRFFRADSLPNTGSLARDLLAAERTFLAWSRTGLGFIALGVALEKVEAFASLSPTLLHMADSRTKLAAGILVASGSGFVYHGTHRYFSALEELKKGRFRPNTAGIMMGAVVTIGIAFAGAVAVIENSSDVARDGQAREGGKTISTD